MWLDKTIEYSYTILCPSWKESSGTIDCTGLWQGVSQFELLQRVESDYVFLFAPFTAIPTVMSMYQESCYDLRAVVPWIKSTVQDLPSIFLHKQRFRSNIEYCFIFQHSSVMSLRTPYSDAICETADAETKAPEKWIRQVVQDMGIAGLNGLIVYRDEHLDSVEYQEAHQDVHKVVLF